MKKFDFKPIGDILNSNQTALILLPQKPTFDQVAAGLSLYLALKEGGKNLSIACSDEMTVEYNHLVGVNKISTSIGGKNLTISFDYLEDSIEKVSYNIEAQKFNLVIEPKPNFPPLDPNKVQYSYSGATADLIIAVGGQKPEDFGLFYHKEGKLFTQKTLINIDISPTNTQFGQINLTDPTASSCCEITIALLQGLNIKMNQDIANNLLMGLTQSTNNFQSPKVTGDTFEAAAICMDYGARMQPQKISQTFSFSPQTFTPQPLKVPFKKFIEPQPPQFFPTTQPQSPPKSTPQPFTRKIQQTVSNVQVQPSEQWKTPKKPKTKASTDWLKPKIYSGSSKF